jgi:hypothetical protein
VPVCQAFRLWAMVLLVVAVASLLACYQHRSRQPPRRAGLGDTWAPYYVTFTRGRDS